MNTITIDQALKNTSKKWDIFLDSPLLKGMVAEKVVEQLPQENIEESQSKALKQEKSGGVSFLTLKRDKKPAFRSVELIPC